MTDLSRYGTCTLDEDGCSTCGDVGIPVRVLRFVEDRQALCEDRTGQQAEVATDFTPEARPGDVLVVHMGIAITRVKEQEEAA